MTASAPQQLYHREGAPVAIAQEAGGPSVGLDVATKERIPAPAWNGSPEQAVLLSEIKNRNTLQRQGNISDLKDGSAGRFQAVRVTVIINGP
jgi:hypothetical protein